MPNIENPQILGALLALAGVIVGAVSAWILAFINRRFDDRRHLRELAITTAVRYWEHDTELAKLRTNANPTVREKIAPLDVYIIHTFLLAELVSSKKITPDNIAGELSRIRSISGVAAESAKPEHKEGS